MAKIAKIQAKFECQAAAIRLKTAEQEALHEAKKATILAQQAGGKREVMSELNALKAELTLAEKQLAKAEAEKREVMSELNALKAELTLAEK